MSHDELFEVLPAGVVERHDFNVTRRYEFLQCVGMRVALLPARVEFTRNDFNHHKRFGSGRDDHRRAAGCDEIDDGAGSATSGISGSVKKVGDLIGLAPF